MIKLKTSIIWKITKDELQKIVNESSSNKEILCKLGLQFTSGGNFNTLKKRFIEDDINLNILKENRKKLIKNSNKKPIEYYLKENTEIGSNNLKIKILKERLLQNKCDICKIKPEWNNMILKLQLDHINGNKYDNRIENLRLLCPNCHSQTETFAGKKTKIDKEIINNISKIKYNYDLKDLSLLQLKKEKILCKNCDNEITGRGKHNYCKKCVVKFRDIKKDLVYSRKVEWPSKEILEQEIKTIPFTTLGKKYGVSDNTIRKWCKKYEIDIFNRKFALKQKLC